MHATLPAAYNLTRTITERTTTEPTRLTLFVYGSLKRGFENHEVFCRDALYTGEAVAQGRLYDLPDGYPGLVVPNGIVQATGTGDPWADAATQERSNSAASTVLEFTDENQDVAHGELLVFTHPGSQLPPLDRLEGFDPYGPSLYRRVLLPVKTVDSLLLAWTYIVEAPSGTHLSGGRWPL